MFDMKSEGTLLRNIKHIKLTVKIHYVSRQSEGRKITMCLSMHAKEGTALVF